MSPLATMTVHGAAPCVEIAQVALVPPTQFDEPSGPPGAGVPSPSLLAANTAEIPRAWSIFVATLIGSAGSKRSRGNDHELFTTRTPSSGWARMWSKAASANAV